MSTTTIRIEDDLKARIAAAAERAGTTTHAFTLDAIKQTVEQVEHEKVSHELADARWAQVQETGKTISWDEAKSYVAARARGERPAKPKARKQKGA